MKIFGEIVFFNVIFLFFEVDPLTHDDSGWYECLASNTQGSVSEKSYLEVIN